MKGGKGIPFDWERLTYVAEHATALNDGESRIFVVEQGGAYNESDYARHTYRYYWLGLGLGLGSRATRTGTILTLTLPTDY